MTGIPSTYVRHLGEGTWLHAHQTGAGELLHRHEHDGPHGYYEHDEDVRGVDHHATVYYDEPTHLWRWKCGACGSDHGSPEGKWHADASADQHAAHPPAPKFPPDVWAANLVFTVSAERFVKARSDLSDTAVRLATIIGQTLYPDAVRLELTWDGADDETWLSPAGAVYDDGTEVDPADRDDADDLIDLLDLAVREIDHESVEHGDAYALDLRQDVLATR